MINTAACPATLIKRRRDRGWEHLRGADRPTRPGNSVDQKACNAPVEDHRHESMEPLLPLCDQRRTFVVWDPAPIHLGAPMKVS
jgi:hypothetical protein